MPERPSSSPISETGPSPQRRSATLDENGGQPRSGRIPRPDADRLLELLDDARQAGRWEDGALEAELEIWVYRVLDGVFERSQDGLSSMYDEVRRAYSYVLAWLDHGAEGSPEFVLGRLACLLEVTGEAAMRTAPEEWRNLLTAGEGMGETRIRILRALRTMPQRPADIAALIPSKPGSRDQGKSAASRRLTELAEAGLVVAHPAGREKYYRLSSAGEEILDEIDAWRPEAPRSGNPVNAPYITRKALEELKPRREEIENKVTKVA